MTSSMDLLRSEVLDEVMDPISDKWRDRSEYEDLKNIDEYTRHMIAANEMQITTNIIMSDEIFVSELTRLNKEARRKKILNYKLNDSQIEELNNELRKYVKFELRITAERQRLSLLREVIFQNLSELLEEHHISQRQLVLILRDEYYVKITPSQFSKMFSINNSSAQEPSLQILLAIAQYFHVSLDRLVTRSEKDDAQTTDINTLTYKGLLLLLNKLEEYKYFRFERHEDRLLTTTGDPGDVEVSIHIHSNADDSGGDDGTIAHYLSMYTSLKKHFPDTPEGHRMVSEMNEMMLKSVSDSPLFSD